ncbi:MAG TPA: hypothetical protein VFO16_20665 [Pseudonocardiaceae bacterium]|nr:hypothetical protein [Pseudonocardiaceae bacterium]
MPYGGRGAPPKYCGQAVDGVRHTRLTAHRVAKGQLTLPAPGSGATPVGANTEHPWSEGKYRDQARPVTAARMMLELLLAEVRDQVVSHEERMSALAGRITGAVGTAADLDAAAAGEAAERATAAEAAAGEALTELEAVETGRDQMRGSGTSGPALLPS